MLPVSARRGWPKGSTDKPRPPDAPPRGRPRKYEEIESEGLFFIPAGFTYSVDLHLFGTQMSVPRRRLRARKTERKRNEALQQPLLVQTRGHSHAVTTASTSCTTETDDEFESYFDTDDITQAEEEEMDRLEHDALAGHEPGCTQPLPQLSPSSRATPSTAELLKQASQRSQSHTFFLKREVFTYDEESDDEGMDSQNEEDENVSRNTSRTSVVEEGKAWFKQPKGMPAWLYQFFRDTVQPLLLEKDGKKLLRPPIFSSENAHMPGSFWIRPPESVIALEGYRFNPPTLYQPHIFLWLPHFFVHCLNCPQCRGKLGKNGALTPRRITDSEDTIEKDEPDADQHTSCLGPLDHADLDDSHKIVKHIANEDGVPIFGAMWTCMTSRYIRAQALTLTKSHEERIGPLMGIAMSAKQYGLGEPVIAYSDDPIKDKAMLCAASLTKNLTPMAVAHGLKSLTLPMSVKTMYLDSMSLVQDTFKPLIAILDADTQTHMCVHRFQKLPASLLSLLISKQVFWIGSSIQADLTCLKKQFNQLADQTFSRIDLKQFAIQRGLIRKQDSGALDVLSEKLLGVYLSKDSSLRQCEDWETNLVTWPDLLNYAALDVHHDTAPGTRVAMLTREGGDIAAYGRISPVQTTTFAGILVKTSNNGHVLVDIDHILIPSAAAILHVPSSFAHRSQTKADALTLAQLKSASTSLTFAVVSPVSLLQFDWRPQSSSENPTTTQHLDLVPSAPHAALPHDIRIVENATNENEDEQDYDNTVDTDDLDSTEETLQLQMLESHAQQAAGSIPSHTLGSYDALGSGDPCQG
ncbi:hypothetical protein B0H10DRAFT_1972477 [Mycena sp. CBHHK59/15]|nr:hypothetical protein B0H10DRAFT_1972477 [Mycena sp. CBHHK59/15]